ncbi:hypothetical protein BaRGS_00006262 [Batillaria attramentaria]|uniref:Uncharacterized protein n=1 Tax=Batillaria attramentaria TaxID=370345 RepID=A0ABD0LRJ2_9CAEN
MPHRYNAASFPNICQGKSVALTRKLSGHNLHLNDLVGSPACHVLVLKWSLWSTGSPLMASQREQSKKKHSASSFIGTTDGAGHFFLSSRTITRGKKKRDSCWLMTLVSC